MLKPISNPTPVAALVTGLNDTASIWWRSSQKRASRMISPNESPGFFSTCTMKGESAMVALLSYALRREQQALSRCRVSGRKHRYCTVSYNHPDDQGFFSGFARFPHVWRRFSVRSERAAAKADGWLTVPAA